jgi:hypothetical protein
LTDDVSATLLHHVPGLDSSLLLSTNRGLSAGRPHTLAPADEQKQRSRLLLRDVTDSL